MSPRVLYGVVSLMALLGPAAFAQQAPQGGPPGGRPDFAQMQKEWLDRMKDALGATDDEWKALEPRIRQVQQLQREASARGMMFGPPPGGPGGPGGPPNSPNGPRPEAPAGGSNAASPGAAPNSATAPRPEGQPPQSAVQQSAAALQEALGNKDASPDEIKATLMALRDARTKAKADLAHAQDELRELLTTRQEALLVTMEILE
jgi:hypothetical protein